MDTPSVNDKLVKFDCRLATGDDFPMLAEWWKKHHDNVLCKDFLSPYTYIVTKNGENAGFFSMHPMDCAVCYFGFPCVNPYLENRERVVDHMIEYAKMWAHRTKHSVVYISIRGEKMLNRLEHAGFIQAETGCSHMFCKIGDLE